MSTSTPPNNNSRNSIPLTNSEWALISKHQDEPPKGKTVLYKQTIQIKQGEWFKIYMHKEHIAFNCIYQCNTFVYLGEIEVLPMARNFEGIYRTLQWKGNENQLYISSNQLILNMQMDEPLLFFCVQGNEEVAFEIEIVCQSLD